MERCRPLDFVSCAAASRPLIRFFALAFAVTCAFAGACGQSVPADPISTAKQLSEEQRWQELVRLVEAAPARSAELDYYYGIALAQLGRLAEARPALLAGRRAKPGQRQSGYIEHCISIPRMPTPMISWAAFISFKAIWKLH